MAIGLPKMSRHLTTRWVDICQASIISPEHQDPTWNWRWTIGGCDGDRWAQCLLSKEKKKISSTLQWSWDLILRQLWYLSVLNEPVLSFGGKRVHIHAKPQQLALLAVPKLQLPNEVKTKILVWAPVDQVEAYTEIMTLSLYPCNFTRCLSSQVTMLSCGPKRSK